MDVSEPCVPVQGQNAKAGALDHVPRHGRGQRIDWISRTIRTRRGPSEVPTGSLSRLRHGKPIASGAVSPCRPSGPDGEDQAEGQAPNECGEFPNLDLSMNTETKVFKTIIRFYPSKTAQICLSLAPYGLSSRNNLQTRSKFYSSYTDGRSFCLVQLKQGCQDLFRLL